MIHFDLRVLIAASTVLLVGCNPSAIDPSALEESEAERASLERKLELKTAEVTQYEETVTRLKGEVAELLQKQSALESQVEILKLKEDSAGELAQCVEQRSQCFAQMSKSVEAVAEVLKADQQAREQAREGKYLQHYRNVLNGVPSSEPANSPSRPASGPRDSYVFVRQPRVDVDENNGTVTVSGTINNTNDESIVGFLRVELMSNGRQVGSTTLHLNLPSNAVDSWETTFRGQVTIGGATFSARAEWDKER